jgi:hypothetical protein
VSETPTRPSYDEPTIMWRMSRSDGQSSHVVIDRYQDKVAVAWFVNGRVVGFRDFDDWTSAVLFSEQMQAQNWTAGWRLTPD